VKMFRSISVLAMFGLSILSNAGCVSLNVPKGESSDTKQRIDSLEQRVSALEAARTSMPSQPVSVPGVPMQSQMPKSAFPGMGSAGYR
jgi:hypothetical protein